MRIALYSRVFPPSLGGMERFAEDHALWLSQQGHEVEVITRTATDESEDLRPYRVLRAPRSAVVLRTMRRADVVHVNGLSLRGVAACRYVGVRPIVTQVSYLSICPTSRAWSQRGQCDAGYGQAGPCRVCPMFGPKGRATVRAFRVGAAMSGYNVCVSDHLMRRLALPRSLRIYNPVGRATFEAASGGRRADGTIAFAGRLVREKGAAVLLDALALIPDAQLEIAGEGPERSALERRAQALRIADRVGFHGSLPFSGVAELYRNAAVVCVPSLWDEPFGYSTAEAMALGRCVVATPTGASPELLADGRGIVARSVRAEDLAATLNAALADPARRASAEASAASFAEAELSADVVGSRYERLYEEVSRRTGG